MPDETPDQPLMGWPRSNHLNLTVPVTKLGVPFNIYVRTAEDDKLEVWILPAGQPDGTLIYGGDINYVFDPTGTELLHASLNFTEFYAVQPDQEVRLEIDRQENDVPSVGDIFFMLSFRDQFDGVTLWNRCFLTNMLDVKGEEAAWLHTERQKRECTKTTKKRSRKKERKQG